MSGSLSTIRKAIALATVVAVTMTACGGTGGSVMTADINERDRSPATNQSTIADVVEGTNQLAVGFFTAVTEPGKNAVIGNHSLSTVLLLAMAGTAGETTDDFARLLGVEGIETDDLHDAVNAIGLTLESRSRDAVRLSIANSLFVQDGLQLRDSYLDRAMGSYGAPVRTVDFERNAQEAVQAVNDWVSDATEGFIPRAVESFPENTTLALANAMYLKARWAEEFDPMSTPQIFHLSDGTTVDAPFMRRTDFMQFSRGDDFTAVEILYRGGELSLVVVQPDSLDSFESALTARKIADIVAGLRNCEVRVKMPKWTTTTRITALEALRRLGLPQEFDFSNLLEPGQPPHEIGSIDHVARIEVDEKGTTAAAATVAGAVATSDEEPEYCDLTVDSPFFYFIRDRETGAILFLGHVANPAANDS
ncbi:MAG: serpin family protein [Acidimicrobiaceae bacterium]|nr:serpin family protein [Acidimicrobiaceae bacterium]MDE0497467.1 serpin family protein [Acidimicrobiaceae bacterium]